MKRYAFRLSRVLRVRRLQEDLLRASWLEAQPVSQRLKASSVTDKAFIIPISKVVVGTWRRRACSLEGDKRHPSWQVAMACSLTCWRLMVDLTWKSF